MSLVNPRAGILLREDSVLGDNLVSSQDALRSLPHPTPRWFAGYDNALKWLDGVSHALCMSPSLASGPYRPLRHFGNTPAPYAYRGLPAFALLSVAAQRRFALRHD